MEDIDNNNIDYYDEIDELIESIYEKLIETYPELNLGLIVNQIEENKWKVLILLWWNYRDIDTQKNRLLISKNEYFIKLEEIVAQWLGNIYMFLLLRYSINTTLPITLKAEPFLDKRTTDNEEFKSKSIKLRRFYESLLFKSIEKNEINRDKLFFNFDTLNEEELLVFYNRLKIFRDTWKWPRL